MCVTDLMDCCETQGRGDWYFPNETRVPFDTHPYTYATFLANRGQYEVIQGVHQYGSVRLWRRFTPTERGRFHCELPSVADQNINQILYVYIGEK